MPSNMIVASTPSLLSTKLEWVVRMTCLSSDPVRDMRQETVQISGRQMGLRLLNQEDFAGFARLKRELDLHRGLFAPFQPR